jgi:hypothetical protein
VLDEYPPCGAMFPPTGSPNAGGVGPFWGGSVANATPPNANIMMAINAITIATFMIVLEIRTNPSPPPECLDHALDGSHQPKPPVLVLFVSSHNNFLCAG